jgi:transcription initiation factor TFIIE subunit beta
MSSYLEKQRAQFTAGLAATAAKMGGGEAKRPIPVSPSPSITSTTSAAGAATPSRKNKRDVAAPIFSQPENTGPGAIIGTNVVYAVEYLKQQSNPISLERIVSHLNLNREAESVQRELAERLRSHPRITFLPDASLTEQTWTSGSYEHKPLIPGVKDKTALLRYLQQRPDAQGVPVKDLKDGWPDCEEPISELEAEHKILVVRTKKDNHPRMVWLDDPSISHQVDVEFQGVWHRVEVPPVEDIVRRLAAVGQKPTSEDPRDKVVATTKEKKQKKRAQRRTGKLTNTHMEHILKNYSK